MADKTKKTPSKKSKGEESAPTFHSELQKACIENYFTAEIVCYVLNAEVSAGLQWTTYSLSHKPNPDVLEKIYIYIAYDNFEKQGVINSLYIKHEKIPLNFLEALFLVLPQYDTFTTIKLNYCNLTANELEFLQTILKEYQNISDLSLDGNPNCVQNFAIVLQNTNIKYISLQRCKINERGMQKICETQSHGPSSKLLTLNLTGNYIDDNAVSHLAKMLRQNRNLRTINLSDNWITDAGCYEIMSSLQNFILTKDEIAIKRKNNIAYYKQKAELIKEYKKEVANESALQSERTSFLKPKNSARISSSKRNSRKDSKSKNSAADEENKLNNYIEGNITKRIHPFTLDIVEKDGEIHCSGNLGLSYINLAYNKISCTGYRHIIEILNYQLANDYLGTGLIYVALDGNADLTSLEFSEIYKILLEKKLKLSSYSASKTTILNRRPNSKYSSILNFA